MTDALKTSLGIHLAGLVLFATLTLVVGHRPSLPRKFTISVQEVKTVESTPPAEPVVQVSNKPKSVTETKVKPVFGLSKNTATDEGAEVAIKAGNTLAKAVDQEKTDNTDALPVPAAEYLVTKMPRLKAEVRIAYPPEARSKNVEGAVVMNVLIDEQGRVREASLLEGPGHGLNEAALDAIHRFQFEPAEIDKKPVAVRIRYAYRFVLN